MRVTLLGHASLVIEAGSTRLLCDPVFFDPFEGDMVSCPRRVVHLPALLPVDAVFLSHGHDDHCDLRSLEQLPRSTLMLCPDEPSLVSRLRAHGFSAVQTVTPFVPVQVGGMRVVATAAVDDDELGVVVLGDGVAVWNQVDTAAAPDTCAAIFAALGRMPDVAICPFNPLLEHTESWVLETTFPLERYERLLEAAIGSGARVIVPGSSGQRHDGDGAWKNQREFPVTRRRFLDDLAAVAPELHGVLLDPGEGLLIEAGAQPRIERTPFAETLADDEHLVRYAPDETPAPPLVDDNPRFPEATLRAHLAAILETQLGPALEARLLPTLRGPLRHLWDRRALVQIEVVFASGTAAWHVAAWHPHVRVVAGAHLSPDYVWRYVGSELYARARGERVEARMQAVRRTQPVSGAFRFTPLDPYRLNDLDGTFVIDDDLPWNPLTVLEPAPRHE